MTSNYFSEFTRARSLARCLKNQFVDEFNFGLSFTYKLLYLWTWTERGNFSTNCNGTYSIAPLFSGTGFGNNTYARDPVVSMIKENASDNYNTTKMNASRQTGGNEYTHLSICPPVFL